jgi:hypothetical protein
MKKTLHFLSYLNHFLECEMFQIKIVQTIKKHIWCLVTFLENLAVYEKMWKDIVQRGRIQITVRRIRIACWITKAANTRNRCV